MGVGWIFHCSSEFCSNEEKKLDFKKVTVCTVKENSFGLTPFFSKRKPNSQRQYVILFNLSFLSCNNVHLKKKLRASD